MQAPSHNDQDQFQELQMADFELMDGFSSSDDSDALTKRAESRSETEIEELLHLLAGLTRPIGRTVVTFVLNDNASGGRLVLPHTEMPPPSRFTRSSRVAARPLAH